MSKIISQLEFWLILFALAAAPNWSWPIFGDASESRMIVIGLGVLGLALFELIRTLTPVSKPAPHLMRGTGQALTLSLEGRGDGIGFGFFKNPLNWIISTPLILVMLNLLFVMLNLFQHPGSRSAELADGMTIMTQFFGFGIPWQTAVWPILLLILWHFLLRGFFGMKDLTGIRRPQLLSRAERSEGRDPLYMNEPSSKFSYKGPLAPAGRGLEATYKNALLKFAFVWLIIFAVIGLIRGGLLHSSPIPLLPLRQGFGGQVGEERDITNIGLWFIIASILALVLSALRAPLSVPPHIPPLASGGLPPHIPPLARGGLRGGRLGRLIYLPLVALIVIVGLFIRFEIRVGSAAAAASRGDFNSARELNPYYPLYALSWLEQEIDNLENMDLTADISAAKQKVGEIAKALENLSAAGYQLRIASAWERLGKFVEGGNDRAISIYDSIISSSGENPDSSLIIKKALLLEKAGKTNEAIEFLNKSIGLISGSLPAESAGRDDSAARYHLGRMLYNSGKEKEAADIWLAILKDDASYADVNYSLGLYFAKMKNYKSALEYFAKVLQLNPDNEAVKKKIDELSGKR